MDCRFRQDSQRLRHPRKRFRNPPGAESYLKKLVLDAGTTGFQDPEREAGNHWQQIMRWKAQSEVNKSLGYDAVRSKS